jgi:hypothetical protein
MPAGLRALPVLQGTMASQNACTEIRAGDSYTRRLRHGACLTYISRIMYGFADSTSRDANAVVMITSRVAVCCTLATFRVGCSPMQMEFVGKGLFL